MMKNLKNHVKVELGILFFFFLSILILQLFGRNYIDNFQENLITNQGNLETKVVEIDDFSKVYVNSKLNVEMKEGDPKIEILSSPEIFDLLDIKEHKVAKRISITSPSDDLIGNELLLGSKITLYYRNVEEIRNGSNCRLTVFGDIETENLYLESSGNARINITAKVGELKTSSSGNATIDVAGSSQSLDANSSGNSHLRLNDCLVVNANANSSGNSSIDLHVSKKVEADAFGNSKIKINGDPDDRRTNSSGNAKVIF